MSAGRCRFSRGNRGEWGRGRGSGRWLRVSEENGRGTDVDAGSIDFGGIFGSLFPGIELENVGFLADLQGDRAKRVQFRVRRLLGFGFLHLLEGRGSVGHRPSAIQSHGAVPVCVLWWIGKQRNTQKGHTGPMSSPRFFRNVGISCSYLQAAP